MFLLVAADGRNTWADCAALMPDPPEGAGTWEQFRLACTANRLVCPSGVDDLIRLTDPSVAIRLRELDEAADFLNALHRRLAQLESPDPHGDSATLRAAAVHHALEAPDLPRAIDLCLDLRYLRLRYAEDPTALTTDLTAVTTATGDPRVEGMRQAVHALAKNRVMPAHFAAQLHDRLRKEITDGDWLDKVFQEPLARPPLRVTRVLDHDALRGATLPRREPGPVLACSMLPDDSTLLLEREAVRFLDEPVFTRVPPSPLKGAVAGPAGSFAAWSEREVFIIRTLVPALSQPVIIELGRPPKVVDFAACLASTTVLATPEGTVHHYGEPYSKTRSQRLLVGHGARITAAADGELLLTASQDGTIRLWDTRRNRARVFTGHRGAVRCATYLPDGRTFVSGGDDGMVLLWNVDRRTPVLSWAGHEGPVLALTVLADGRVVSASADNTLRIWPPTEASPVVLTGHEDAVTGCLETAGGVLSWSADGTVRLWSPRGGPAWHVARGFPGGIRSMTAVGNRYTILCGDGSVEARILPTRPSDVHVGLGCLAVRSEDVLAGVESQIAVVHRDGTPRAPHRVRLTPAILSTTPGEEQAALMDEEGEIWTLDSEGRTSPLAESLGGVHLGLDRSTDIVVGQETVYRHTVWLVVRYPGTVTATRGRVLQIARTDGSFLNTIRLPATVTALASGGPLPDRRDRIVVAGTETGNVHLFDGATGEEWRTLVSGAKRPITAVAVADGGNIVIGAGDGNVRIVPAVSPGPLDVRHAHDGPVTVLATAGARVVSGGQDGRLVLWDVAESEPVHTVVLEGAVTAVAAADTWLAARDASGNLWLLDLDLAAPRTVSSPFSQPGAASIDIADVAVEGNMPDQELVVRCRLFAAVDLELRAVLLSVGSTEMPTSMSLDATTAPDPGWAAVDPDGGLRLPLWLSAGEDLDLWMRTRWSADLPPANDLTVTLRLALPHRAWQSEMLRVQGTAYSGLRPTG
ncbi:WD40 repeat domain-containing protein [Kitasatospora arboriphila]